MRQARSANESRSMMKSFERSHKDLYQGEDVRNPKALIDSKGKKLQNRMNAQRGEDRKAGKSKHKNTGARSFSQKAQNKIVAGSRPTRSKMIVKSGGGKGKRR